MNTSGRALGVKKLNSATALIQRCPEEFGEYHQAPTALQATQQTSADDSDRAAKMAPRNSPDLTMIFDQQKQRGNANRATFAVARKMVAYLVGVNRRQKGFLVEE